MIKLFSYRIFLLCLVACAGMTIGGIWLGGKILPPVYFQTIATLFVVGLAFFLIWFTRTLIAIQNIG